MYYLSWADQQIPICFVTGLSYAKRAKVIEHTGGYVSTRGFEAAEISVQIQVTRSACMAFDLNFDEEVAKVRSLRADKDSPSGGVTLGGYPIYPELQFALTNINTTFNADSVAGVSVYACDLVLSGVECTKEVCRNRALEFAPETVIPSVSLKCKGKKLILQDGNQISGLITSPNDCEVECILGADSQKASRKGFIQDVIDEGGTIEIDLPSGLTVFNVISASLNGNILSLTGSIFPESAYQAETKTFRNKDIKEIVETLLRDCGADDIDVRISGMVDYFRMSKSPLETLEDLQNSAGFIVNARANKITVAWVPDIIDAQKDIEGTIIDDDAHERIAKVLWKDGLHEVEAGDGNGETIEINSCFSSSDKSFAGHVLAYRRYNATFIAIEGVIDNEIGHHSQVGVLKDDTSVPCIVDFYQCDWVNGIARYECRWV